MGFVTKATGIFLLTAIGSFLVLTASPGIKKFLNSNNPLSRQNNISSMIHVSDNAVKPITEDVSFEGDVFIKGKKLDLSSLMVAPNAVYSISAGKGISSEGDQNITLVNTGVTSLQGETGDLALSAGSGISVNGLAISNNDPGSSQKIFKTIKSGSDYVDAASNTDTFEFAAGSGISLSLDNSNKKLTITRTGSNTISSTGNGLSLSSDTVSVSLLSSATTTSTTSSYSGMEFIGSGNALGLLQGCSNGQVLNWNSTTSKWECATISVGSVSVTSIEGLTGDITISNATGSGSIITIDDASTSQKGIAQFNSTNFSSSNGTINTIQNISTSSTPTFTGLTLSTLTTAGILHNNGSGTISSSAINLAGGATEITGILPLGNGGTGVDTFSAGDMLYYTSGTALSKLSIGGSGLCLTSTGSAPSWSSCGGSFWRGSNGAISPINDTLDLLIGGTSTTSAKFGVLNMDSGTPTASISANSGFGALYLRGDGVIASTAMQSINIGGSTTGDILLKAKNGLGTVNITSDLSQGARTLPVMSITQPNNAGNNSTSNLLQLTNSDSGSTVAVATITQSATGATAEGLSISAATGRGIVLNPTTGTGIYFSSSITSGTGIDFPYPQYLESGNFIRATGSLSGGLTGFSGDFINISPTRTHTGATSITDSGNFLDFTRSNAVNNASGTFNITGNLVTLSSNCTSTNGTCNDNSNILSLTQNYTNATGAVLEITNAGHGAGINLSSNSGGQAAFILNKTGNNDIFTASSSGTTRLTLDTSGNLNIVGGEYRIGGSSVLSSNTLGAGITSSSLTSVGTLTGGTWNANAIGSQYGGTGQNFSSSTGIPSLSSGTWSVNASLATSLGGLGADISAVGAGELLYSTSATTYDSLAAGNSGECLTSGGAGAPVWTSCANATGIVTYWDQVGGALTQKNTSLDFLLGGTSTDSAKFAILGVNNARGSQTASLSGNLVLDTAGSLHTTNNQTLTLGGGSTGDLYIGRASQNLFMPNFTTNGGLLYTTSTGLLTQLGAGTTGNCLTANTGAAPSWGSCDSVIGSAWNLSSTDGTLSPINNTLDFLLGGTSTDSAKFAVLNMNGTGPATATVSGNLIIMPNNGAGGTLGIGLTNTNGALLAMKDRTSLASLGSEKITNASDRDFSTDSGNWTSSGTPNWKINLASSEKAVKDAPSTRYITLSNSALDSAPVSGKTYHITFTYTTTASSSGTLIAQFGGVNGPTVGHGTFQTETQTQVIKATGATALRFTPSVNWYGTIDNISIKEITSSSIALQLESSDGNTNPLEVRSGGDSLLNTFIGNGSGRTNTTGYNNTAFGYQALINNTTGYDNTANGYQTLYNNTTGYGNTANGSSTLRNNTTGFWNTATGYQVLYKNTTGFRNTASGYQALYNNTTGYDNTANGFFALYNNTTGYSNTASGINSLLNNTTGLENTATGQYSLYSNTSGNGNTATGLQALYNNTLGRYNTGEGYFAGFTNTVGGLNTFLGYNADAASGNLINATAIGANAYVSADDSLVLGSIYGINSATGSAKIGIGTTAPLATLHVNGAYGSNAVFILNQTNSGDLFTASSSGSTKFTIKNDGTASTSGNLVIDAAGSIQTTKNQTLTIGGSTTGSVHIKPNGGGTDVGTFTTSGVGIFNTNPTVNLDVGNPGFSYGATVYRIAWNNGSYRGGLGVDSSWNNEMRIGAISDVGLELVTNDTTRAYITNDGKFGVGYSEANYPLFKLAVTDTQTSTVSAFIENSSSNTSADVLALQVGVATPGTGNYFTAFLNGNGAIIGKVRGNGSGGVVYDTAGGDYAEWYKKADINEQFEAGDIVCLTPSGVSKCTETNGTVLGAISDTPGFVGKSGHENDPNYVLVGLLGQVKVKVDTSNGLIHKSDFIGPSSNQGVAAKALTSGFVLGRALEEYDPQSSTILVAVSPTYYADTLAMGDSLPTVTTNASPDATVSTSTQSEEIASLTTRVSNIEDMLFTDRTKIVELTEQMKNLQEKITQLEQNNNISLTQFASSEASLVTVINELFVPGTASLNNVSIADILEVGNSMRIGNNSIDTVGADLSLQGLRQGAIDLMAGSIIISPDGVLHVNENAEFAKDVAVKGVLSASTIRGINDTLEVSGSARIEKATIKKISIPQDQDDASAGVATLPANSTSVTINSKAVTDKSLIFITPTTRISGQQLYVSGKQNGQSFTVSLPDAIGEDIKFNYLIIN